MALKGLDIFKMSPKKNCKECGSPTCMAFCMKVAQGAVEIDKCPYFSEVAKAMLYEQTAPAMKTISVGEHKLGGETVLFRHEKTLVSKNLYAVSVCTCMDEATVDAKLADLQMPIVAPVSTDTWGVKESCASEEDEPTWGDREERAISMEISTAAANLTGGADAVIMRHPAAIATIKKFITELV